MIGGVLTYEIKSGGRACGQTIGADGSGEFAVVINGTPDDAEQWARDYLRKIEASGAKLGRVVFVRSEECFTGPMVMEVTPNADVTGLAPRKDDK